MKTWLKGVLRNIKGDLARAHKSLTIWFNSILGTVAVLLPEAQASVPQLQEYLPANVYQTLMAALVIGNIILRFNTVSALRDK